jgi:hypothetical protein
VGSRHGSQWLAALRIVGRRTRVVGSCRFPD